MINWKVEKFDLHHIKDFAAKEGGVVNEDPAMWKLVTEKSEACSFFFKGKWIFSGGILVHRAGFGEAWILCSKGAAAHPVGVFRVARDYLNTGFVLNRLYRLQAIVRCDWPQAQKFVKRLGFVKEGVLKKYGADQSDYIMYARVE